MLPTLIGVKLSDRARIEGRKGLPKGKETVGFVPLGLLLGAARFLDAPLRARTPRVGSNSGEEA